MAISSAVRIENMLRKQCDVIVPPSGFRFGAICKTISMMEYSRIKSLMCWMYVSFLGEEI